MTREMGNLLVMHKAKCIINSLTLIRPIIHPRRLCNKRHKQHMHGGKNEVHITNKLVERKLSFALVGFLQNRDCFRINNADWQKFVFRSGSPYTLRNFTIPARLVRQVVNAGWRGLAKFSFSERIHIIFYRETILAVLHRVADRESRQGKVEPSRRPSMKYEVHTME